jgi:hypothetical protein
MEDDSVTGRFSTLEKAHQGRLMTALNHQDEKIMLFNEKTKKFIPWKRKELSLFEKYKEDPSAYFDMLRSGK